MKLIGTYTIALVDSGGNTKTDIGSDVEAGTMSDTPTAGCPASSSNCFDQATTTGIYTVTVRNTADNTGYPGTRTAFDVKRTMKNSVSIRVAKSAQNATVTGILDDWPLLYTHGTNDHIYWKDLSDSALDRQKNPDGTFLTTGTYVTTFSYDIGPGTAHGISVVVICYRSEFTSAYYTANGAANIETVVSAIFAFNIKNN